MDTREIIGFAGHAALTVNGKRDPVFDGYTANGYRREYTLSELTPAEKRNEAERLLVYHGTHSHAQARNVIGAVACYGGDIDALIEELTR